MSATDRCPLAPEPMPWVSGNHLWVLWSRNWLPMRGWQETWYCSHCRTVEERIGNG